MDSRQLCGLLVFFIFYAVIGAAIFMVLESAHPEMDHEMERQTLIQIKEIAIEMNETNGLNIEQLNQLLEIIAQREFNLGPLYEMRWGFFNSFFFAITVITTVGYGHFSPTSPTGRVFCIIYALFGIPLTGILLGAIGDRFSHCFIDKMNRITKDHHRNLSQRVLVLLHTLLFFFPWFIVFHIIPAFLFHLIEKWSFSDSFYYCFVTLSTIGFGDFVPGQYSHTFDWVYKILIVCWITFGLAYLSMILNFISKGLQSQHFHNVVHSIRRYPISRFQSSNNYRGNKQKHVKEVKTFPHSHTFRPTTLQILKPFDNKSKIMD